MELKTRNPAERNAPNATRRPITVRPPDRLEGTKTGGVKVFGGGLALYASNHVLVGGVGVSGDTSCADHNIAWRVRTALGLDHMAPSGSLPAVGGVSGDPTHPDNIIFDIAPNPNGGTGV